MEVRTALTGPFPRSEALVAATRDLDRGRTTAEAVAALYDAAESEVARLEEQLGLDVRSGGYLDWADLFRPFSESWRGFTVGPVTRCFEPNTFSGHPTPPPPRDGVGGATAGRPPRPARAAPAPAKVTLPGPFTFAGLLDNRSGETREALTHRLGRLLSEEVRELGRAGYRTFQFQEPLLVTEAPEGPRAEAALAAYRPIAEAAAGATTVLWTFFGDAAAVAPLLARFPVDVVGIDLSETDPADVPGPIGRGGLGLGCIDPRTTLAEDPEAVARIARELGTRRPSGSLWLGAGAPLDLLPPGPAARKLELLPRARRLLASGGGPA